MSQSHPHRGESSRPPHRSRHSEQEHSEEEDNGHHRHEKSEHSFQDQADEKSKQDQKGEDEEEKGPSPRTKKIILISAIAAVVLILVVGVPWWLYERHFEDTDDAFIDVHWEKVAPQVSGRVVKVLVHDNDLVQAGQIVAEIDPSDFNAQVEKAAAALAEAQGKVAQAQAQKKAAEASVEQSKADLDRAEVNRDNAETELKRYEALSAEAVSRQQLDNLRTAARSAEAGYMAADKAVAAAQAQVDLASSQIVSNQAGVKSAQAQLDQANLYLSWTHIKAINTGRVTQRGVADGDYVTPASQLMLIVPQDVWVTANFKETQLTYMRPGQPVSIQVDAYPDVDFQGHVQSIQSGSGVWYGLLPPENATGNYVKVVQRVPVKITFDDTTSDAYKLLSPGMSVVPKVRVR